MNKLAIILVMYRQKNNLDMLYGSLAGQTEKDFKIYFVDNNPDNSDTAYSKELNSSLNIEYLPAGGNIGFAAGSNLGAQKAINDGYQNIFFLNNDMVLENSCIEGLLKTLESDTGCSACSPIIFYWEGSRSKGKIQEYGANVNYTFYKIFKLFESESYGIVEDKIPGKLQVDLLSGGACCFRAETLKTAGLWEESYFAYGDEIDLSRRLWKGNFKCCVNKKAVVWHNHKWDKENKQGFYFEYYMIQRNKFLYFKKYHLYLPMLLVFLADIVKFPVRLLWFIKVCDFKLGLYYLKGTIDGLLNKKGKPDLSFVK